ncbi:hypothetical protein [Butyricicoccus sp.]|uniref:hypothetical protein n=1 Tax=Butyricicoccus sp. TaxID=2049021 RepID=UPI003D7C4249
MTNTEKPTLHLTPQEIEFCISALQIEIENVDHDTQTNELSEADCKELDAYAQRLGHMQDQLLTGQTEFRPNALLPIYDLIKSQRNAINDILDNEAMSLDMRQQGQQHVRTANAVLRKLKKYLQEFEIDV